MRAVLAEKADIPELIAKQHQSFAQDFARLGDIDKLLRRSNHDPVAAKPFAARRPRSDVGNIGSSHATAFSFGTYFCQLFALLTTSLTAFTTLWALSSFTTAG